MAASSPAHRDVRAAPLTGQAAPHQGPGAARIAGQSRGSPSLHTRLCNVHCGLCRLALRPPSRETHRSRRGNDSAGRRIRVHWLVFRMCTRPTGASYGDLVGSGPTLSLAQARDTTRGIHAVLDEARHSARLHSSPPCRPIAAGAGGPSRMPRSGTPWPGSRRRTSTSWTRLDRGCGGWAALRVKTSHARSDGPNHPSSTRRSSSWSSRPPRQQAVRSRCRWLARADEMIK
jgi:hypothetical protein